MHSLKIGYAMELPLLSWRGSSNFMCIVHKWGSWYEFYGNQHPYKQPKEQERSCLKCCKTERRPMPSLECRLIEEFKKAGSEKDFEKVCEYFKKSYGVARYTRITKSLARY